MRTGSEKVTLLKKQPVNAAAPSTIHLFSGFINDPQDGTIYDFDDNISPIEYLYNNQYLFTIRVRMKLFRKNNEIVFNYFYDIKMDPNSYGLKIFTRVTYGLVIYCQMRDKDGNIFPGQFEALPYHSNCSVHFGADGIEIGAPAKIFAKSQSRPSGVKLEDVASVAVGYRQNDKDKLDIQV